MNLYPSDYEGHKAWMLLLHNLFVFGGLTCDEAREAFDDSQTPSFFELHTDDIYCWNCYEFLGTLNSKAMNAPTYCHCCTKSVLNLHFKHHRAYVEIRSFFKYSHTVRAHNYLIKTVSDTSKQKGTYHAYTG